jgi:uncharacterized protein
MNSPGMIDRLSPTRRPAGRAVGYQSWRQLTLVHWRVPAAELRPLVPARLQLDLWDGDCWVAIVPFRMAWVRPAGLPALPWL